MSESHDDGGDGGDRVGMQFDFVSNDFFKLKIYSTLAPLIFCYFLLSVFFFLFCVRHMIFRLAFRHSAGLLRTPVLAHRLFSQRITFIRVLFRSVCECVETNQPAVCVFFVSIIADITKSAKIISIGSEEFRPSSFTSSSLNLFSFFSFAHTLWTPKYYLYLVHELRLVFVWMRCVCAWLFALLRFSVRIFYGLSAGEFPQGNFDFGVFRSFWF